MSDLNDQEVEDFLSDNYNDFDLDRGIHSVAILFSERALPRLLEIIQSSTRSFETRKKAALAIRDIGAESVTKTLSELQTQGDPQLKELATDALSYINR